MKMKKLLEDLKKARYDRQSIDLVIMDYLLIEDDNNSFSLVSSIRKLNTAIIIKIIDIYLEETYQPTVEEILKEGKVSLFEFNDVSYRLSAIVDGSPIFTLLTSADSINPPFNLSDRVKRCY